MSELCWTQCFATDRIVCCLYVYVCVVCMWCPVFCVCVVCAHVCYVYIVYMCVMHSSLIFLSSYS